MDVIYLAVELAYNLHVSHGEFRKETVQKWIFLMIFVQHNSMCFPNFAARQNKMAAHA
jgi:hypothetical protein